MSQQYDPNQYGQGGQGQSPQGQYPQGQYPPPQYPQQPQYPPNPYEQQQGGQPQYPPQQYGQQYGQPYPPNAYGQPMQGYGPVGAQAPARPKETNPYAGLAIGVGALALVVVVVAAFFGYYIVGFLALYGLYAGIRGLIIGIQKPTHPGLILSTLGLVLSGLSILLTIGIIALSAASS